MEAEGAVPGVKIKICGIHRPQDADFVNTTRPDFFGMIINFPKSHRNLSPVQAAELRKRIDGDIPAVGVFVNQPMELIAQLLQQGTIQIAQLHGQETPDEIIALQRVTGKPVWKAFRVRSNRDIRAAEESPADLVLLDNGYGTGQVFDWGLAGGIHCPFALAGGLNGDNLQQAILTLKPVLVDVSSGVETEKIKDLRKMEQVISIARNITARR